MAKKQETNQPYTQKQGSPYDSTCPHCGGTKKIKAPAYPGFEDKPTLMIPCIYCK